MVLSCRYYAQKFPEIGQVVLATVSSIHEMEARVVLSEYNGIEGIICIHELTRRRIRSVNKLIRVGSCQILLVIHVDTEKDQLDLSKRCVSYSDVVEAEEKFARAKIVNNVLRHVAEVLQYETDEELEALYKNTAWYFEEKLKRQAASYDVFRCALTDPSILNKCSLDERTKEALLTSIKLHIPQTLKIRAVIEVSCFGYEGIDAVKDALRAGLSLSTEVSPINIILLEPPKYFISTTCAELMNGLKLLEKALHLIKEKIEKHNGRFDILQALKVMTKKDELALTEVLDQLKWKHKEVIGDYDSNEDIPDTVALLGNNSLEV